jgi:UDP-N-acetylglucosamine--N-acetylmuramyl-(pentapeptide) pyrophosphoryl-undecaprenol N-acetylglucosamine transferase
VAEDHQTHNAMALVRKNAALLVKDNEALDDLLPTALGLLHSPDKISQLQHNIESMALRNASQIICDEIYRVSERSDKSPSPEERDLGRG